MLVPVEPSTPFVNRGGTSPEPAASVLDLSGYSSHHRHGTGPVLCLHKRRYSGTISRIRHASTSRYPAYIIIGTPVLSDFTPVHPDLAYRYHSRPELTHTVGSPLTHTRPLLKDRRSRRFHPFPGHHIWSPRRGRVPNVYFYQSDPLVLRHSTQTFAQTQHSSGNHLLSQDQTSYHFRKGLVRSTGRAARASCFAEIGKSQFTVPHARTPNRY